MKTVRHDIARIYTIAREAGLGYRTAPSTEGEPDGRNHRS